MAGTFFNIRASAFVSSLAMSALIFGAAAPASAGRSAQGNSGMSAVGENICRVRVTRSATVGAFNLTRQVFNDGKCVCSVTTGPRSQGGSAESAVASLLLRRTCANAPLAAAGTVGRSGLGPLLGAGALLGGAGGAAAGNGNTVSP